jgi:hypothetical protein
MAKIKITNLENQAKNLSKEQVLFVTGIEVEELSSEQSSLVVGGLNNNYILLPVLNLGAC